MSWKHEDDKIIAFERAGLLFVFNFHPQKSFADYKFGIETPGEYKIILSTDDPHFGGHNRIDCTISYFTQPDGYAGRRNSIQVNTPTSKLLLYTYDRLKNKSYVLKFKKKKVRVSLLFPLTFLIRLINI